MRSRAQTRSSSGSETRLTTATSRATQSLPRLVGEQRRRPAYERAGDYVARIVQPERDSGEADQTSRPQERGCRRDAENARTPNAMAKATAAWSLGKEGSGEGAERRCVNAGCVTNGRGRSHR